jgi:hypothetical protein
VLGIFGFTVGFANLTGIVSPTPNPQPVYVTSQLFKVAFGGDQSRSVLEGKSGCDAVHIWDFVKRL